MLNKRRSDRPITSQNMAEEAIMTSILFAYDTYSYCHKSLGSRVLSRGIANICKSSFSPQLWSTSDVSARSRFLIIYSSLRVLR